LALIRSRPVRSRFVVEIVVHWVRAIRPVLANGITNVLRCVNSRIVSLQLNFAGLRSSPFWRRVSVGCHQLKPQACAAVRTLGDEPTPRNYHDFTFKRKPEGFGFDQQSVPTLDAVTLNEPCVYRFHEVYFSISDRVA
jgi:hypothetical protein